MPIHYKDKKSKALSTIDSALTILEKIPDLDSTNSSLSMNMSANPFQFIMDLLKTTAGYDYIIQTVSKFISAYTPILEASVKAILIANMKNLLSCSLDFRISDDIIRDGIAFDARSIDLLNILRYSPLTTNDMFTTNEQKMGRYYYFDCEDNTIPEDLLKSKDFNAFIWYMINKSDKREVWGKKEKRTNETDKKDVKKNGILTLEYHERSGSMTNAINETVRLQCPLYNCIHAFLGNTEPNNVDNVNQYVNTINDAYGSININNKLIKELKNNNYNLNKSKREKEKLYKKGSLNEDDFKSEINKINNKIEQNIYLIKDKETENKNNQETIVQKRNLIKNYQYTFNDITKNYYYHRTIIEFNYDYIMSLTIFDSKNLAAQLIDALTGCISMDLNLSYEQYLVKEEVKKIVNEIINTDHADVSDCFFAFSNDDYNEMLKKAEMVRNGMLSINGEQNGTEKINADEILSGLNNINKNSTQEEINTVIEDTITNLSKTLSKEKYKAVDKINFGVRMNIIESLLNELAQVIVTAILSPKLYILLSINLKLMENKSQFDIRGFIELFKQFIVKIIREVRDIILKYLVDELMKIVGGLAKEIAVKLTIEQADYYYKLIRRLIDCFKSRETTLDFNIDNVDYADIISSESEEPENNIC